MLPGVSRDIPTGSYLGAVIFLPGDHTNLLCLRNTIQTMTIEMAANFTSALLLGVAISGCSAGPSSRTTDGKWDVSENICSSDPDNPDLGDMRSEIRQYAGATTGERQVAMFHRDRRILRLTQKFNHRHSSGNLVVYENSPENSVVEEASIRNIREVNNDIDRALVEFFEDDPSIDGENAKSFCLYRGQ